MSQTSINYTSIHSKSSCTSCNAPLLACHLQVCIPRSCSVLHLECVTAHDANQCIVLVGLSPFLSSVQYQPHCDVTDLGTIEKLQVLQLFRSLIQTSLSYQRHQQRQQQARRLCSQNQIINLSNSSSCQHNQPKQQQQTLTLNTLSVSHLSKPSSKRAHSDDTIEHSNNNEFNDDNDNDTSMVDVCAVDQTTSQGTESHTDPMHRALKRCRIH